MASSALEHAHIGLNGYGLADYPAGTGFGPRRLRDHQLVWLLRGRATWHCQGRPDHVLPPGEWLWCRPGDHDGFTWDARRSTRHGFIHFDLQAEIPAHWPRHGPITGVIGPLLDHALALAGPDGDRGQWRSCMRLLLQAFVSGQQDTMADPAGPHDHPLIAALCRLLQEAWADGGPLRAPATRALASDLGVSCAHLSRICRQQLDCSPQELIRRLRLDRAASLLAHSDLAIQAVAERCGFESPFHFSRCFKRVYGQSPRAMRQAIAAGAHRPTISLHHVHRIAHQLQSRLP